MFLKGTSTAYAYIINNAEELTVTMTNTRVKLTCINFFNTISNTKSVEI